MNPIPPSDPDPIQKIFNEVVKLIESRQWSALLVKFAFVASLLFVPKEGFVYRRVPEMFSEQYPIQFFIGIAIILMAALLIKLFNLDGQMPRRWAKFSVRLVAIIFLVALIFNIVPLFMIPTPPLPEGDRFSWGEEFLIPADTKCKNAKDNGTIAYKNARYKDAEDYYRTYVKDCKDATEAQIYLNNAMATQTEKPFKIAVSVPISRNDGEGDSKDILRGAAIAQYDWNRENK